MSVTTMLLVIKLLNSRTHIQLLLASSDDVISSVIITIKM